METSHAEAVLPEQKLPKAWFASHPGSAHQAALLRRLAAAPQTVLLLDYDGTLAPFHADKMQARPYPGIPELLGALLETPRVRLVFVTGRRAGDLPHLIELASHIEIWGSHGREHVTADGQYTQAPVTAEQHDLLDSIADGITRALHSIPLRPQSAAAETPFEPIERKPGSLAVHWRGLDDASRAALQNAAEAAFAGVPGASIQQLPFASGIEFRATGYTKAIAIRQTLQQSSPEDVVAYLGDDLTDEDAFAALGQEGLSLLVGTHARPTHAQFWLSPPAELLDFLGDWLHALQRPRACQPEAQRAGTRITP